MKLLNKLASKIAKAEGKKRSITIGDAREIVGILSDILYDADGVAIFNELMDNGSKRASKRVVKEYSKYKRVKSQEKGKK